MRRIAICLGIGVALSWPGPVTFGSVAGPNDGIAWNGTQETRIPYVAVEPSLGPNGELTQPGFEGLAPEPDIVFGSDDSTRVNPTTSFPYRAVVYIETGGGSWCTGWMAYSNSVATAAHCLYDNGAWKSVGLIYPGKNGSTNPYGSCSWWRIIVPSGWITYEEDEYKYDYGIINLNCTIGQTVGWLSFGVRSNQLGIPVRIDGYPQADGKPASTMWQSPGKITDESTDIWHYDADTWHGDSGAYVRRSADNVVMGINSHDSNLLNFNAGVRFTLSVYNNLTSWRDDTCC
jgi:glutamyl endopeptidase